MKWNSGKVTFIYFPYSCILFEYNSLAWRSLSLQSSVGSLSGDVEHICLDSEQPEVEDIFHCIQLFSEATNQQGVGHLSKNWACNARILYSSLPTNTPILYLNVSCSHTEALQRKWGFWPFFVRDSLLLWYSNLHQTTLHNSTLCYSSLLSVYMHTRNLLVGEIQ